LVFAKSPSKEVQDSKKVALAGRKEKGWFAPENPRREESE